MHENDKLETKRGISFSGFSFDVKTGVREVGAMGVVVVLPTRD